MPSHAPILLAGGAIAAGIALYAMNKKPVKTITGSWEAIFKENDWKEYVRILIRYIEEPLYFFWVDAMQNRSKHVELFANECKKLSVDLERIAEHEGQDEKTSETHHESITQKQMMFFASFLHTIGKTHFMDGGVIERKIFIELELAGAELGVESSTRKAIEQNWSARVLHLKNEVVPDITRYYTEKIKGVQGFIDFADGTNRDIKKEYRLWAYVEQELAKS